ncbi:uncharacterized protein LOC129942632 [Eupeodes corollae]|uniref:uncharacterized protein LOC129942632 n=1 Tax=Eupeodes corollae TaxID=290404 RepID=UPI0024908E80|nr:uncharacterized protein LOC129942632 [Eupeodes corollae]
MGLIPSCSVENLRTSTRPREFDETEIFVPVVANETATTSVNALTDTIITDLKSTFATDMMSDESINEDDDDSVKDPDFLLPEKSPQSLFSGSDIDDMATQLEQNLGSEDHIPGNSNLSPETVSTKESRKGRRQKRNLGQNYLTSTEKTFLQKG